jgi:hypothetical protein
MYGNNNVGVWWKLQVDLRYAPAICIHMYGPYGCIRFVIGKGSESSPSFQVCSFILYQLQIGFCPRRSYSFAIY